MAILPETYASLTTIYCKRYVRDDLVDFAKGASNAFVLAVDYGYPLAAIINTALMMVSYDNATKDYIKRNTEEIVTDFYVTPDGVVVPNYTGRNLVGAELDDYISFMINYTKVITNNKGLVYPSVKDPRTGENIPFSDGELKKVPMEERVVWDAKARANFIKEWYDRGYQLQMEDGKSMIYIILFQRNMEAQTIFGIWFPLIEAYIKQNLILSGLDGMNKEENMNAVTALMSRIVNNKLEVQLEDGYIVEMGFEWNPPASEEEIKDFESMNMFTLPMEYKEFLKITNGAVLFKDIQYGQWGCRIHGLSDLLEVTNAVAEWGYDLPPSLIVFATWLGDTDLLLFDLEKCANGERRYIVDGSQGEKTTNWGLLNGSFSKWIDRVIVAQGAKYWKWY